jgi:tetratricopeptide (TPR) repeat protein
VTIASNSWDRCDLCGVGLKSDRRAAHRERVHPNALTAEERAAIAGRDRKRTPRPAEGVSPTQVGSQRVGPDDDALPEALLDAFARGEILHPADLVAHPAARAWTLRRMLQSAREGDPRVLTMALQLVTFVDDPAERFGLAEAGLKESPIEDPWLMLAGWAALGVRKFDRAVELATRGLERVPELGTGFLQVRGMARAEMGQWIEAETDLRAALPKSPDRGRVAFRIAQCWESREPNAPVEAWWTERMAEWPDDTGLSESFAEWQLLHGQGDAARSHLGAMAEKGELGVDASLVLATDRYGAGDRTSALKLMDQAADQVEDPEEAAAVAGILASLGEPKRARRLLERAPMLDRSDGQAGPLVTLARARIELAEGHPRKSLGRLRQLLGDAGALSPSDLMLAAGSAWEARSAPVTLDYLDAFFRATHERPAASLNSLRAMALELCTEAALTAGMREKARWALSELRKMRPDAPETLRWRLKLSLLPDGEPPEQAREALTKVVGERDARLAMVEELYEIGREPEAMEEAYRAIRAPHPTAEAADDPSSVGIDMAWVWLDFLGAAKWGPEEHRARLEEWTRTHPSDPMAWAYRAFLIEQTESPEAAQSAWDEAEAKVGASPLFQLFVRHRTPEAERRPMTKEELKHVAEVLRSLPRPVREHLLPGRNRRRVGARQNLPKPSRDPDLDPPA